jgi:hypothetical protein
MTKKVTKQQSPSVGDLADELGALRASESDLGTRDKTISAALIDALGVGGAAEGKLFRVVVVEQERSSLDLAAVRDALSEKFLSEHTKPTTVVFVKVSARKKV